MSPLNITGEVTTQIVNAALRKAGIGQRHSCCAFPLARIDGNFDSRCYSAIRADHRMPERFVFSDLRELFAKANEEKSGDQLGGLAARSERERVAAKRALADLSLAEIVGQPLIDPASDDVTRLILDTLDQEGF